MITCSECPYWYQSCEDDFPVCHCYGSVAPCEESEEYEE